MTIFSYVFANLRMTFFLILIAISGNAIGANQVVINNNDSGAGSFRQAVADVGDGEEITFNLSSGNEIITVSSGFRFHKGLIIDGSNTSGSGTHITIQVPIPGTSNFQLFFIDNYDNQVVTMKNMSIKGGNAGGDGGSIRVLFGGGLVLINCTVSESEGDWGGGIMVDGGRKLTMINSTVSNCVAERGGGGIYNGGFVTLINSTITGNRAIDKPEAGAGIYNDGFGRELNITNSIIAYNYIDDNSAYQDIVNGTIQGNYNIIGDYALSGIANINYSYTSGKGATLFDSYETISANNIYKPILADNGGTTQTVAIAKGSIAAGAGVKTGTYNDSGTTKYAFYNGGNWINVEDGTLVLQPVTEITTDQRGEKRADPPTIGAYEIPITGELTFSNKSVNEMVTAGTVVGELTTSEGSASFTYSIIGGADHSKFELNTSNQIVTNWVFDFENQISAEIIIRSDDGAGQIIDSTFTITINDLISPITFSGYIPNYLEMNEHTTIDGTTTIDSLVLIPAGDTLVISAGDSIVFNTGIDNDWAPDGLIDAGSLLVKGLISAVGNVSDTIVFTSSSRKEGEYWGAVLLDGADNNSIFQYCKFEYSEGIEYYTPASAMDMEGALNFINSNASVTNSTIIYCNQGILCIEASSIIDQNSIVHIEQDGIRCQYGSHTTITNNSIIDCYDDGIDIESGSVPFIENNLISYCDNDGIEIDDALNMLIINRNRIINNSEDGIDVEECDSIRITNCYIANNGNNDAGIEIDSAHFFIAFDTIVNSGSTGVVLNNNSIGTVTNCIIRDNNDDGIFCQGSATNVRLLFNRIIRSGDDGIDINEIESAIINNNYIAENTGESSYQEEDIDFLGHENDSYEGIEIKGTVCLLKNDTVANNSHSDGIDIAGDCNGLRIEKCIISQNDNDGIDTNSDIDIINNLIVGNGSDGIEIDNSNPRIINNTVIFNFDDGIELDEDNHYPIIINTIVYGNDDSEIEIYGGVGTPTVSFSLIQGGYPGIGNIDAYPMFTDTLTADYSLQGCSPAINAGKTDTTGLGLPVTDLVSEHRIQQLRVDIGAFEGYSAPVALCKDVLVVLDSSGFATITVADIDNGSYSPCDSSFVSSISVDSFTCIDIGENIVTLTLFDVFNNFNSSTCNSIVTIEDTISPILFCTPLEIVLYENGEYVLNENDIAVMAAGTFDNCTSFEDLVLDVFPKSFECVHVGEPIPVKVTATDGQDNVTSVWTTVTVYDETPPVALCKDLDIVLDESGKARIIPSKINGGDGTVVLPGWARTYNDMSGGSYDACGISILNIDQYNFNCSDVGENTVTLTVVDGHGNTSTCESTVTVSDNIVPVVEPVADLELVIEPGLCDSELEYPELIIHDNCETTQELTAGLGPDGMFPVGTTTETWLVTDDAGNTATVSFDITIVATNAMPTINEQTDVTVVEDTNSVEVTLTGISGGDDCEDQDVTVTATGDNAELITSATVDYATGDSTGIITMMVAPEMAGEAKIIVTVEDEEGGMISDTFMVTVTPVNDAPFIVAPIADQTVYASYVLKVPVSAVLGNIFDDFDDDELTIEVIAAGTDSLPIWATMMGDTLVCTPTIADTGCVNMVVTATDAGGLSVSDTFAVCVDGYPVSISEFGIDQFEVQMYPNPTRGIVIMEISSGIYEVQLAVMDITGKIVLQKQYSASENITFDMSGKVSGMYFVKMNIDGNQLVKKLIVDRK